jgi:hypothetical protein
MLGLAHFKCDKGEFKVSRVPRLASSRFSGRRRRVTLVLGPAVFPNLGALHQCSLEAFLGMSSKETWDAA